MKIIKQKQKGILTVISGPSGAGKDSIVNEVVKRKNMNVWVSISMTSREPRGIEQNGKEYFLLQKSNLKTTLKKMIFWSMQNIMEIIMVHLKAKLMSI